VTLIPTATALCAEEPELRFGSAKQTHRSSSCEYRQPIIVQASVSAASAAVAVLQAAADKVDSLAKNRECALV
jgi:hypothetical protein